MRPFARSFVVIPTCLALLLAFLVAPFEHVHAGHGAETDHDHSGVMHAHFYNAFQSHVENYGRHGQEFDDDDDDDHASARNVDTFTLVLTGGLTPFIPSWGQALVFIPTRSYQPVAEVEERGHDPPAVDRSIPRAPPA